MTTTQIEHILCAALGTSKIAVEEFPPHLTASPSPQRSLLINIGPLALDLPDAPAALAQCHDLIHRLLDRLTAEADLLPCDVGISVFAEPGGQAFRALSGSIVLTASSTRPYPLTGLYSNIRVLRSLMSGEGTLS
jgi:hypothetical protein